MTGAQHAVWMIQDEALAERIHEVYPEATIWMGDPDSLNKRLGRLEANLAELRWAVQWLIDGKAAGLEDRSVPVVPVPKLPDWARSE